MRLKKSKQTNWKYNKGKPNCRSDHCLMKKLTEFLNIKVKSRFRVGAEGIDMNKFIGTLPSDMLSLDRTSVVG